MLSFPASVRIFVATGARDMRKSFDGLCGVVQDLLDADPFTGHVFAFCNRRWDTEAGCARPSLGEEDR